MRYSDPFVQDVRGVRGAQASEQYASEQDDTPRADEPVLLTPIYQSKPAAPDVYDPFVQNGVPCPSNVFSIFTGRITPENGQ